MLNRIITILFVSLLYSCNPNTLNTEVPYLTHGEVKVINVDMSNKVPFDDVVENLQYVKLEENDNALFTYISKFRVYKDRIYVLDHYTTKTVFVFDTSGKYINSINNIGRANNEFLGIVNMEFDYVNEELILDDDMGGKLLFYDRDGNFIRTLSKNWRREDYAMMPDGKLARGRNLTTHLLGAAGTSKNQMLVMADTVSAIDLTCKSNALLTLPNSLIATFNGNAIFIPELSDTIYVVTSEGYYPKYRVNIPEKNKLPLEIFSKYDNDSGVSEYERTKGMTFTWGGLAETDSYMHVTLGFFINNSLIYSKKSGKSIVFDDELFSGVVTSDENGKFWVNVFKLRAEQSKSEKLKKILPLLGETDANIIISFDLKDF